MKKLYILLTIFLAIVPYVVLGNELVGTIDVKTSVSESGGSIITLPLDVPVGIQGMQPNLALVYNSQSGLGIAGWGWDLSGASSITRIGNTPYYDNKSTAVEFSNDDNLSWDGNRLILKSGYNLVGGAQYSTEIESFDSIKYVNNYFQIKSNDGKVALYGDEITKCWHQNYDKILSWNISRVTDLNGNYIAYYYSQSTNPAECYLSQIQYTGNGTSTTPQLSVSFEYINMPAPQIMYVGQSRFAQTKLLRRIRMSSCGHELYNYELSYDTTYVQPRLMSVKKTASNGDYYRPVTFTWASTGITSTLLSCSLSTPSKSNHLSGDFNGDGLLDYFTYDTNSTSCTLLINTSPSSLSFTPTNVNLTYPIQNPVVCDYNGDGVDEVIFYRNQDHTIRYLHKADLGYTISFICNSFSSVFAAGDFDGDGYAEVLVQKNDDIYMYGYLQSEMNVGRITTWSNTSGNIHTFTEQHAPFDYNGDGKTDILIWADAAFYVFTYDEDDHLLHSLDYLEYDYLGLSSVFLQNRTMQLGDFNGDGKTDIVVTMSHENDPLRPNGLYAHFILSKGVGVDISRVERINWYYPKLYVGDYNHDGISDICCLQNDNSHYQLNFMLNNGNNLSSHCITLYSIPLSSALEEKPLYVDDIHGRGLPELVCFISSSSIYSLPPYSEPPLHVKTATDGIGNQYSFTYKPVSDPSVYSFTSNDLAYPLMPLKNSHYVTATYTAMPYVSLQYTYGNGIIHSQGKGLLGFSERTVIDNKNNKATYTSSSLQNTYYYLMPSRSVTTTIDGDTVSTTFYTTDYKNYGNKNVWPYISSTTCKDYLTTLSSTTSAIYNDDGTPWYVHIRRGSLEESTFNQYGTFSPLHIRCITSSETLQEYEDSTNYQITYYNYDNKANLIRMVEDSLTSSMKLVHSYDYDHFGNRTKETISGSNQSRVTKISYSSSGRFPTKKTDAAGQVVHYNFDDQTGVLQSERDTIGTTTYTYNSFGQKISTHFPDGVQTTTATQYVSGVVGVKYSITDTGTNASPVTTWYNASGKPVCQMKMSFGGQSVYTVQKYYENGSTQMVSEPFFGTSVANATSRSFSTDDATFYTYDAYGRVLREQAPGIDNQYIYGGLTTTIYKLDGALKTVLNDVGWIQSKAILDRSTVPIPGPLLMLPFNRNKAVTYAYFPTGLVKSITPDGGMTINLRYDEHGNRTLMDDPDAGEIRTTYNAFDQIVKHKQAIHSDTAVVTTYTYSSLDGKLLTETTSGDNHRTKTYTYNSKFPTLPSRVAYNNNEYKSYSYDAYGRTKSTTQVCNDVIMTDEYSYSNGLMTSHSHIENDRIIVRENYTYDSYGNQISESIADVPSPIEVWELLETNARGQILREKKGNKITTYTYDNAGRVLSMVAPGIMNLSYTYDEAGNVATKCDGVAMQYTTYTYDDKNRLTNWLIQDAGYSLGGGISPLGEGTPYGIVYDQTTGNIDEISEGNDIALLSYMASGKPHALESLNHSSVDYAPNYITYNDKGKMETIDSDNESYQIVYGVDESRIKSILTKNNQQTTRYYGNGLEKVSDPAGNIDYLTYLCHGAIAVHHTPIVANLMSPPPSGGGEGGGSQVIYQAPTMPTYVLQGYYDAQGSLIALVNNNTGAVVQRYAYDPWGKRVDPFDWTALEDSPSEFCHINRGYTMHEHLDDFCLINMNGRVYDPTVVQFLSPDNYIQDPYNWLNYNRYAYCYFNPLLYYDPSGEFLTWSFSPSRFSIGWNFGDVGLPIGIGVQYSCADGISIGGYIEFGWHINDTFDATISYSIDRNITKKEWSGTVKGSLAIGYKDLSASVSSYRTKNYTNGTVSNGFNVGLSLSGQIDEESKKYISLGAKYSDKKWSWNLGMGINDSEYSTYTGDEKTKELEGKVEYVMSYGHDEWNICGVKLKYISRPKFENQSLHNKDVRAIVVNNCMPMNRFNDHMYWGFNHSFIDLSIR